MPFLADQLRTLVPAGRQPLGIVVVDHGSKRRESNELLEAVARQFADFSQCDIVEPAHMELAEPTIDQAFDRCVERGARTVVVFPYFLAPGRHWSEDIPRLAAAAASRHPEVHHVVTAPLGLHPLLSDIMARRISDCLAHSLHGGQPCQWCEGKASHCQLR